MARQSRSKRWCVGLKMGAPGTKHALRLSGPDGRKETGRKGRKEGSAAMPVLYEVAKLTSSATLGHSLILG
jgi:hypothetical protein